MAKELALKVNAEPTIFNKEMIIGTFLLPIPIVGSLVGGYIGKSRMKTELEKGRVVSDEPSAINKDTLMGGLLGGFLGGGLIGNALGLTAAVAFGPEVGLAVQAISALIGVATGAYVGSNSGVSRQKNDFQKAKHQEEEKSISNVMGRAPEREQEMGKGKDFAINVDLSREQAQHHNR